MNKGKIRKISNSGAGVDVEVGVNVGVGVSVGVRAGLGVSCGEGVGVGVGVGVDVGVGVLLGVVGGVGFWTVKVNGVEEAFRKDSQKVALITISW